MAHPDPLQEADKATGLGNGSTGPTFKQGTVESEARLTPPFPVDHHDEAAGDTVHEIDIYNYGYCYEPKGTARVTEKPMVTYKDNEGHDEYNHH